ncbi:DUF1774 domain-containing protein [Ascoidea rubescens DSM 1968]|uniref:DUF1774-domain-containing protein n=1 Tax=Ascoidea rubescens DSM 1968 TaxID=1344418 RepID=A0A1D2VDS1_9ASCO|nr:DUF1774-domain-containing protein [Ascoidea rubescens DSM 1968]ODV59776.1 DUF1774-domain-containing protein [Ascoidea rubescens DSM 1968]
MSSLLLTNQVLTILSYILSIFGNFRYLIFGKKGPLDDEDPFHLGITPFTANIFFIFIFWLCLYGVQLAYIIQLFYPDSRGTTSLTKITSTSTRLSVSQVVGWHFTSFNILTFLWAFLFSKNHYILSELIVVINFFNILALFAVHKTYKIQRSDYFFLIHLPTSSIPLAWLFYLLFWNGAVMFHFHENLAARILANIFIWNFLFVPVFVLVTIKDWSFGLANSYLMFALGFGQLGIKVFALQWIFAFIISAVLFFFSVVVATGSTLANIGDGDEHVPGTNTENAPLLPS